MLSVDAIELGLLFVFAGSVAYIVCDLILWLWRRYNSR